MPNKMSQDAAVNPGSVIIVIVEFIVSTEVITANNEFDWYIISLTIMSSVPPDKVIVNPLMLLIEVVNPKSA